MKKYNSEVSYALYVQNNIKKDDYARLNIGKIVKVTGIRENNVNKKAIYYGIYDNDWFDCMAVENFSTNLIDLIEVGDFVNGTIIEEYYDWDVDGNHIDRLGTLYNEEYNLYLPLDKIDIKTILTKELYNQNCYKVVD